MQNIHCHAWNPALHFDPQTIRETDLSRGYPLDLTVNYEQFMADMAPFDKVLVFGLKARLTGYWVPDEYIAGFVSRAPDKLVGFAACDPTQPGHFEELRHGVEELGLRGVKMGPVYAGFDRATRGWIRSIAIAASAGCRLCFTPGPPSTGPRGWNSRVRGSSTRSPSVTPTCTWSSPTPAIPGATNAWW